MKTIQVLLAVFLCMAAGVWAAEDIGKVTKVDGKAKLLSGESIQDITKDGVLVKSADKIQTEDGSVEVQFNDGATLKVKPFSTIAVDEKTEEKGVLFFKTRQDTRRVTATVGKAHFQSGEGSGKKNYLQTPTAVCALRGTDGDFGYDNQNSYLNLLHGEADVIGQIVRGAFPDFDRKVAENSPVYKAIAEAAVALHAAGVGAQADAIAKLNLQKAVLAAVKLAAEAMVSNPDPAVQQDAKLGAVVADAAILGAEANIMLELAKQELAKAAQQLVDAKANGDEAAALAAQQALDKANQVVAQAEQAVQQMQAAIAEVQQAVAAGDLGAALDAQDAVKELKDSLITVVGGLVNIPTDIAPPAVLPPTDQPPTDPPPTDDTPADDPIVEDPPIEPGPYESQ